MSILPFPAVGPRPRAVDPLGKDKLTLVQRHIEPMTAGFARDVERQAALRPAKKIPAAAIGAAMARKRLKKAGLDLRDRGPVSRSRFGPVVRQSAAY
jgi:hypothetical protein